MINNFTIEIRNLILIDNFTIDIKSLKLMNFTTNIKNLDQEFYYRYQKLVSNFTLVWFGFFV